MLVLSRKGGDCIMIGDAIKVTVVELRGDKVRIGIEAPRDIPVHREEVYRVIQENRIDGEDSSDFGQGIF
jgi:carbon storage regulator